MLTKKQIEDGTKCSNNTDCKTCKIWDKKHVGTVDCIEAIAQTALAYRKILERLEWKGVHSWVYEENGCPICGNEKEDGHAPDCELAVLLNGRKG